jgi:hypothetical protein
VARRLGKKNRTTHIMHDPFKTLEGVLWVLQKCESTIRLLDECLKAYFISRSKSSSCVKSHDYHVLLMQMITIGIHNILPVNVQEAILNFCFFQCNWSKSTKQRSSRVIRKKAL